MPTWATPPSTPQTRPLTDFLPYSTPPICHICELPCTEGKTKQANRNGNSNRPYYKCDYTQTHGPGRTIIFLWNDLRRIDEGYPLCDCGWRTREDYSSRNRYHYYTCAIRRCKTWISRTRQDGGPFPKIRAIYQHESVGGGDDDRVDPDDAEPVHMPGRAGPNARVKVENQDAVLLPAAALLRSVEREQKPVFINLLDDDCDNENSSSARNGGRDISRPYAACPRDGHPSYTPRPSEPHQAWRSFDGDEQDRTHQHMQATPSPSQPPTSSLASRPFITPTRHSRNPHQTAKSQSQSPTASGHESRARATSIAFSSQTICGGSPSNPVDLSQPPGWDQTPRKRGRDDDNDDEHDMMTTTPSSKRRTGGTEWEGGGRSTGTDIARRFQDVVGIGSVAPARLLDFGGVGKGKGRAVQEVVVLDGDGDRDGTESSLASSWQGVGF